MMQPQGRIALLPPDVARQIAAGEVVERPASVVKELLENAIDAGSAHITVEIHKAGRELIRVTDDGCGIMPEDVHLAFVRHATSKLRAAEDLFHIEMMGFRGEALYSIGAVSRLTLVTKRRELPIGSQCCCNGGELLPATELGAPDGTSITVEDLFFNVPARQKFLKGDSSEAGLVSAVVARVILSHPDVAIKLIMDKKTVYQSTGDGSLLHTIHSIYGKEIATHAVQVEKELGFYRVSGYIGLPAVARGNRSYQTLFMNGRPIQHLSLSRVAERAYAQLLPGQQRFPFFVLSLEVPPELVDVNVHPNKLTVRFADEKSLEKLIYQAIGDVVAQIGSQPVGWEAPPVKQSVLGAETVPPVSGLEATPKSLQGTVASVPPSALLVDVLPSGNPGLKDSAQKEHRDVLFEGAFHQTENLDDSPRNKVTLRAALQDLEAETAAVFSMQPPMESVRLRAASVVEEAMAQQEMPVARATPRLVGLAFATYALVEYGDSLYIIDQHAAHERLLFDAFIALLKEKEAASQPLLIPQTIHVTYDEKMMLSEMEEDLAALGFEVEEYGRLSFILRAVPHVLGQVNLTQFFSELLDRARDPDETLRLHRRETIMQMACKRAVKAGDMLHPMELERLIELIDAEGTPLTCPHGRPFVMQLLRGQIEKQCKRVM